MNIESSYILLSKREKTPQSRSQPKTDTTQKDNNNGNRTLSITVETCSRYISEMKRIFPDINEVNDNKNEYDLAFRHLYSMTYGYKDDSDKIISVDVQIRTHEVKSNAYIDIMVQGNNVDELIQALESIQITLLQSNINKEYIVITTYDAISEYYCNLAYPHLNNIERKLRKLLFNIYIVNFEDEYYQRTISAEIQEKAKKVMQTSSDSERLKQFFYSLEFNDIQSMLFTPQWTDYEEGVRKGFLESNDDLGKLSDQELRKVLSLLKPRNDWERLFSNKMNKDEVSMLVEEIRGYRNNIAHCKRFTKKNFNAFVEATDKLSDILDKAIQKTEEKDFALKNTESMRHALSDLGRKMDALFGDSINSGLKEMLKTLVNVFVEKKEKPSRISIPQIMEQLILFSF